MINLEDKIISYLDGTLDETSRAELLHTLSVSPEKRKLLEEHIKLREIISLGHKPASVPLLTERKLADRIPMLMQELPYLAERSNRVAAPIIGTSTSYFALLGRQVTSFFTSRVGQVVSVGTLALLGGLSWYMAQSNGNEQVSASKPDIAQSQSVNSSGAATADQRGNGLSSTGSTSTDLTSTGLSGKAETNSGGALPEPGINRSDASSAASQVSTRFNRVSKATKSTADHTDASPNASAKHAPLDAPSAASKSNASNASNSANSANADRDAQASAAKNGDVAKQNASQFRGDNSVKDMKPEPQNAEQSKSIKEPRDLPPLPLPSRERNVTGHFTFQAQYSTSANFRPNVEQQQYEYGSGIGSPVFGLGYELDPHFAISIEGGKSSLSQQQQTVDKPRGTQGPVNSPISVNERVTYTTGVNDVNAVWTQAMLRYTFNPNDALRFELSGGAGAAFIDGLSPMVSLGIATTYDLGEVFALTGGITGRGAWLSGLNAEDPSVATTGGGHATAVVSHRPSTSDLFSSSIAGRIGFRVRFF